MKSTGALALLLVLSLLLVPSSTPGAGATASAYSEKLEVYVVGQNALWSLSLNGINATIPAITAADSIPGVSSYNLTAARFSSAVSDFQVFWKDGYGLVPLPFQPAQGLFLSVSSANQSAAERVAAKLGGTLRTSLVPITNSSPYLYYSSIDFSHIATPILFKLVPQSVKGFASVVTQNQFSSLPTPMISLTAQSTASGFKHSIVLSSAQSAVLHSNGTLSISSLFKQQNESIPTSPAANSSMIVIHSLNGFILSPDGATRTNDVGSFSGSYVLSAPHGRNVRPNVTLVQDVPTPIGTRVLDRGSLIKGDFLTVTLRLENRATKTPIQNLVINDSWWKNYPGLFQLSKGNSSLKVAAMAPDNVTQVTYVLKLVSQDKNDVIIPSLSVDYQFLTGAQPVQQHLFLNQAEVRTNDFGPAISLTARPNHRLGSPVGVSEHFTVTATNVGNGTALNLKLENYSTSSLLGGQSWRVNVSVPVTSLIKTNVTRTFNVQWETSNGQHQSLSSNRATVIFSQTGMNIPFTRVSVNQTLTAGTNSLTTAVESFAFQNAGHTNASTVEATQSLPPGLSCANVTSGEGKCVKQGFSASFTKLGTKLPRLTTVVFSLVAKENFLIPPINITTVYRGLALHTYGAILAIPAGLSVSKTFEPNPLFEGMLPTISVGVSNSGSRPIYNATISSSFDSFDQTPRKTAETMGKTFPVLSPGSQTSFNYSVLVSEASSGNNSVAPVRLNVTFGGMTEQFSAKEGHILVLKTLQASLTTIPSQPVEAKAFSLEISIANPSSVDVSDVKFTATLPTGVDVLNSTGGIKNAGRSVVIDIPHLSANSSYKARLGLRVSTGMDLNLGNANLTFSYGRSRVNGFVPSFSIPVSEDITTRYTEPIVLALLALLAVVVTIRRRVPSVATAPSSQPETPRKQPWHPDTTSG